MNMYNYSYSGRYMSSASGIYQAGTKDCAEKRITMNNQEMMELTTVDKSVLKNSLKSVQDQAPLTRIYISNMMLRGVFVIAMVMVFLQDLQKYLMYVVMRMFMVERYLSMDSYIFRDIMSRILLKALQEIDSVLKKQLTFFYLVIFLQRNSLTVSLEYLLIYRNFQVHLSEM